MAGWSVPGVVHLRQVREDPAGLRGHARHRITRRPLAITYLSPEYLDDAEFRTRFREEYPRMSRVRDVRAARVYRYIECDQGAAVVSEQVNGITLRALLLAQGAVGIAAALVVLNDALLAVAACHQAGLAHGDIKPEDVIITRGGRARLVDFGLWTSQGRRLLARSTPFYLAPEQWSGSAVSQAGDVYAATITFFECLVGAPPFYADGVDKLSAEHQSSAVPIEVIPEPVRELVLRGLSKDPCSRPQARSLLPLVRDVAAHVVGADWERQGRRELAAHQGNRSALADVRPASRRRGGVGRGYGKPVRLAAVIGGALALAAGLSSPPLAVLPGISIFNSGGRPPVLAFPEPDRGTVPVRAVTKGPLADRAPTPAAKGGIGTRPVPALPTPGIQTIPYERAAPDAHHPGAGHPDVASREQSAPDQSSPACMKALPEDHKPCSPAKFEQPNQGSGGSATDPSEVTLPVALPIELPAPIQVPVVQNPVPAPVPVQLPAPVQPPVQVPKATPPRGKAWLHQDIHGPKDAQAQLDSQRSSRPMQDHRSERTGSSVGPPTNHYHQRGSGDFGGAGRAGNR